MTGAGTPGAGDREGGRHVATAVFRSGAMTIGLVLDDVGWEELVRSLEDPDRHWFQMKTADGKLMWVNLREIAAVTEGEVKTR